MPVGGTAFLGQNQSPRITTNYLNQLGRSGDPAPGVNVSTAQMSGSIVQPYGGMVGSKLTITNPWAAQFSDPAVGPLYGGVYQYVQLAPSAPVPPQRGQVLYWLDELNYIVTSIFAAGMKIAGVSVNRTTPGNWDFIQIAGIANVAFSTATGAAIGSMVADSGGGGAIVTTVTASFLGIAVLSVPVAGQVSPVELNLLAGLNY